MHNLIRVLVYIKLNLEIKYIVTVIKKRIVSKAVYTPKSEESVKQKVVQKEITRLKPKYTKEKHTQKNESQR